MPLSGLSRVSVRPRGGVAKVEIVPARLWAGASSASAAAWAFREDRARYSEGPAGEKNLVMLVRHTLEMELPAGEESRRAVDELSAASGEGFVALVTMASGEVLAAGYSERFGTLYPLRMAGVESSSGRTPADFPTLTLTLESVDADPSKKI